MTFWKILDTGSRPAEENMRLDAQLLASLNSHSPSILHFYDWAGDSATYGYFIKPDEFLDLEKVKSKGLFLARRPTGGGIVFHIWDLAFSVLVPSHSSHFSQNTLENYQFVNRAVLEAIKEWLGEEIALIPHDELKLDEACGSFCMARPTKYDVMLGGKKVAGAAQRQCRNGFLHQGTIALVRPCEDYLKELLLPGNRVLDGIRQFSLQVDKDLPFSRKVMRELLTKHLTGGHCVVHTSYTIYQK
jgi:lipoate-protein ligase A